MEAAKALADSVKKGKLGSLHVFLKNGLTRVAGGIGVNEARLDVQWASVDENIVTVIVNKGIDTISVASSDNKIYFALNLVATDNAGDYAVTSDYAAATSAGSSQVGQIAECVLDYFCISNSADKVNYLPEIRVDSLNYREFEAKSYKPFENYDYIHCVLLEKYQVEPFKTIFHLDAENTNLILEKNFLDYTGLKNFVKKYQYAKITSEGSDNDVDYPYSVGDSTKAAIDTTVNDLAFKFPGVATDPHTDTLQRYVKNSPWFTSLRPTINGIQMQHIWAKTVITRIQHNGNLPDLHMYWNYKQYAPEHRYNVLYFATADSVKFNDAVKNVTPSLTINGVVPNWVSFLKASNYIAANSTFGPDWKGEQSAFYHRIDTSATGFYGVTASENNKNQLEGLGKTEIDYVYVRYYNASSYAQESDEVTFGVKVAIDSTCGTRVESYTHAETLTGSVTKAASITIKDFMKRFLVDPQTDTLRPVFVQGLKAEDVTIQEAINAAWTSLPGNLTADSSIYTVTPHPDGDSVVVEIEAGSVLYNNTKNFAITGNVFGQTFVCNNTVEIGKLPFNLRTRSQAEDTKAIGKFNKDGYYTLTDLYYNKQVEVYNSGTMLDYELGGTTLKVRFSSDSTDVMFDNGLTSIYAKSKGVNVILPTSSSDTVSPLVDTDFLRWQTEYNYTKFKTKAVLYVCKDSKEVAVDSVEYNITTDTPLRLVKQDTLFFTRQAGQDLTFQVDSAITVYGLEEGKEVAKNRVAYSSYYKRYYIQGHYVPKNVDKYFIPSEPSMWTVEFNGKTPKSWINGTDYIWDPSTNGHKITIKGDNLAGSYKIVAPFTFRFWLDDNVTTPYNTVIIINQTL